MDKEKEEWETGLDDLLNSYDFQDLSGIGEKEISQLRAFIRQQIEQARREGVEAAIEAIPSVQSYFVGEVDQRCEDYRSYIIQKLKNNKEL